MWVGWRLSAPVELLVPSDSWESNLFCQVLVSRSNLPSPSLPCSNPLLLPFGHGAKQLDPCLFVLLSLFRVCDPWIRHPISLQLASKVMLYLHFYPWKWCFISIRSDFLTARASLCKRCKFPHKFVVFICIILFILLFVLYENIHK